MLWPATGPVHAYKRDPCIIIIQFRVHMGNESAQLGDIPP